MVWDFYMYVYPSTDEERKTPSVAYFNPDGDDGDDGVPCVFP